MQIVITDGRWNLVGVASYDPETDELLIVDAAVIRRWGTTKGIGELRHGPTKDTVLDFEGTCRIPRGAVLRRIEVDTDAWAPALEALR